MIKTSRPIVKGVTPRPRLFNQLDRLRNRPVIWISAPAGSGKTTLASSYFEDRRIPCLWYQLDQGDGDPATFFHYFGAAMRSAQPRRRKPLPALAPEYQKDVSTFALRFFEQVYERLSPPSFLVFDNYQDVPPDSLLHEALASALSIIPQGIQVLVISRSDPPPQFIRLRANRQIGILEWPDIRLTKDEAHQLISDRSLGVQSEAWIERLHAWSDGWAAGLMLMSEVVRGENHEPPILGNRSFESVFDYFAREVFAALDQKAQKFLLTTAFLPRMSLPMVEELAQERNAGELLRAVRRSNAFITTHDHGQPMYEYHQLYRRFLLARARRDFPPEVLAGLERRAADILKKFGMAESAMDLLQEIKAWPDMTAILLECAPEMIKQGRHHVVQDWLRRLPDGEIKLNPWLLYWQGMSALPFAPGMARICFEAAFSKFQENQDQLGAILAASGAVNAIAFEGECFSPLDHWFSLLNDLIKTSSTFPSLEIEAWATASMITALSLREIPHPDAPAWIERALNLKETPETINPKIHALFQLYWYQGVNQGMDGLSPLLQILQRLAHSPSAQPLARLLVMFAEAQFAIAFGHHEQCLGIVDRAMTFSQKHGIQYYNPSFQCLAINSFLNHLDIKAAQGWLDAIRPYLEHSGFWSVAIIHQFTREALIRQDFKQAEFYARRAAGLAKTLGSPMVTGCGHWMLAQALHRQGQANEAQGELDQCFSIVEHHGTRWVEVMALFYQAQFALDRGDQAQGLDFLGKSLALAREHGYLFTCLDDPHVTLQLCEKALENGIEVDHAQRIIRRRRLVPDKPPLHIPSWPWAVRIFTLKPFVLEKDGESLPPQKKAQQMPLRLLKALIALGGRDIPEERVTELLWPDADGDTSLHACETTLFRLRKLIGYPEALRVREGRITMDDRYCWVDAWAFERLAAEAEVKMRGGQAQAALDQAEIALALYQTDFLAGEYKDTWLLSYAERLKRKWRKTILVAGDLLEAAGRFDEAKSHYEQGLDLDETNEDLYLRLMTHCRAQGRANEAMALYNRCAQTLAAIGAAPSPDVEALRQSLLSA